MYLPSYTHLRLQGPRGPEPPAAVKWRSSCHSNYGLQHTVYLRHLQVGLAYPCLPRGTSLGSVLCKAPLYIWYTLPRPLSTPHSARSAGGQQLPKLAARRSHHPASVLSLSTTRHPIQPWPPGAAPPEVSNILSYTLRYFPPDLCYCLSLSTRPSHFFFLSFSFPFSSSAPQIHLVRLCLSVRRRRPVLSTFLALLIWRLGRLNIPALVANDPPLDGRIAPNNYLARNDIDIDIDIDATDTNSNNTPYAAVSTAAAATIDTNLNANTGTDTDTSGNGNGNGDAANDYFFRSPDIQHFILNRGISGRYSFAPLPSPQANDSFFATIGDALPTPFYATPNTANLPLRLYHGALFAPALQSPLPTPQTPAPAHPDRHSSFRLPECLIPPRPGGYHFPVYPRNHHPQTPQDIQGSNRLPYSFPASSLSSLATTPTTLSQPHMSNINPRPTPPLSQAQCFPRPTGATPSIDDHYLNALVTQDFSSPSLPPLSNSPSPTTLSPSNRSGFVAAGQEMPPSTRRRISNRGGAVDLTKQEPDFEAPNSGVDSSIPLAAMPAAARRRSVASVADTTVRKRRPSAATSPTSRPSKARRKEQPIHRDSQSSPFEDDVIPGLNGHDGSEPIDLCNATEVPAELMAPKVDNRVKIGKFQCVICMDDTTALTVTHCGM